MSRTSAPSSYMGIPVHRLPKLAEFKAGAPRNNRMLSELGGSSNTLVSPLTTSFRVMDLTAANAWAGVTRLKDSENPSFNAASGLTHMKTRSGATKEGISLGGFGSVTFHHLLYANGTNRPHRGVVLRGALGNGTMGHLRATETQLLYDLQRRQEEGGDGGDISEFICTSWRTLAEGSSSHHSNKRKNDTAEMDTMVPRKKSPIEAGHGFLFQSKKSAIGTKKQSPQTDAAKHARVSEALETLIPRFGFEVGQRESIEWLGAVLNPHQLQRTESGDFSVFGDKTVSDGAVDDNTSESGQQMKMVGKDRTLEAGYFPSVVGLSAPKGLLDDPSTIKAKKEEGDGGEGMTTTTTSTTVDASKDKITLFDAPADTAYGVSEPWRMGTSLEPHRRVVVQDEFVSYATTNTEGDDILINSVSSMPATKVSYTPSMDKLLRKPSSPNNTTATLSWNEIKRPFFQHVLKETMLVPTTRLLLRMHVPRAIADMCTAQNDQQALSQVQQGLRPSSAILSNNKALMSDATPSPTHAQPSYTSSSILFPSAPINQLVEDVETIYCSNNSSKSEKDSGIFRPMHRRVSLSVDNFGTDRPVHEVRVGPGDVIFIPRGWKYELLRELGRSATDLLARVRRGDDVVGGDKKGGNGAVQLLAADSLVKDNAALPGGRRKHVHTALLIDINNLKKKKNNNIASSSSVNEKEGDSASDYVPEFKRRNDGWGRLQSEPTVTQSPPNVATKMASSSSTNTTYSVVTPSTMETQDEVEEDEEPSRLLSCDCFKISFRPFPVLTEKQREIYLSSDYGTSVEDFYENGGNDPLKHFVH